MGAKPDIYFAIEGELLIDIPVTPDKEDLKKTALANRPDLKSSAVEAERTRSAIDLTKREAFPNVTVSAFYERDELRNTGGLRFSVPLPLIDRKQAEKKIAIIRSQQTAIRYPNLQRMIEREVEEGYLSLISSRQEIAVYNKEMLGKSLENLDLLNLAFREGKNRFLRRKAGSKGRLRYPICLC